MTKNDTNLIILRSAQHASGCAQKHELALAATCHTVRAEALKLFYTSNDFKIVLLHEDEVMALHAPPWWIGERMKEGCWTSWSKFRFTLIL